MGDKARFYHGAGLCHKLRPSELRRFDKLCEGMPYHQAARQLARERQSKAYLMKSAIGLGFDEIAEMLGTSLPTARMLVRKGGALSAKHINDLEGK